MAPPPLPVEPEHAVDPERAAEAAEVPLPPVYQEPAAEALPPAPIEVAPERPTTPPRPQSRLRKKSMDTSPEQRRQKKKATKEERSKGPPPAKSKQPPSGFRQFFGARRDRSKERQVQNAPLSPADPNPAIAAARAALEGRNKPQDASLASPSDTAHLAKLRQVNNTRREPQRPITPPSSDHDESVTAQFVDGTPVSLAGEPATVNPGPPRTRRDEEYENLSRVDTNEREDADREFSQFDQGPLVEQPAFVPRDSYMPTPSPQHETFATPYEEDPKQSMPGQFSVYGAVTAQDPVEQEQHQEQEMPEDEASNSLTQQVSPMDRWAQIRKNAAERAAKQAEEPVGRPSHTETRTDDGETSGEESELAEPPYIELC